ncbi:MAG TPA: RNA methyltransferase [Bacteroidales bacterium]|mgnify:FL=1|nr:RNA methyltransferase [Bacteroidales bacterium]HRR49380.1 RNA methyltransferase [Bacteroidales bacterium]
MFKKLHVNELGRLSIEEFKQSPKIPVVIVLDDIRSRHNIGAAFRTADAFAVESIVLCGICATPPNNEIHKSALGAEETVTWKYESDILNAITNLKAKGYRIICAEQTENSTQLQNLTIERDKKYAVVFGNEVKGVRQEVLDICDVAVEIPQFGTKHSLNVSVSIGIILWEMISQGFMKSLF